MQNEKKNKYDIKVEPQTLFLLVGPSMSGKTTFARHAVTQLETQLREAAFADWYTPVIRHINSDDIRRSLYGISDESLMHKYDTRMVYASHAAFEALTWQVNQAMRLPFNADFIIVDSTGLDPAFRDEIRKIAESNSYKVVLVLFDFRKNEDYFKGLGEEIDSKTKFIVHKHIRRLREGYSTLKLKNYDDSVSISRKEDIEKVSFQIDTKEYRKSFLNQNDQDGQHIHYQFFGDVQGCYKTLVALLEKDGFKVDPVTLKITGRDGTVLVFVGDLIDKGPDSIGVVRLLLANKDRVRVVMGNHENFVYKFLTGKLKDAGLPEPEIIDTYFTSVNEFKKNPEAIPDFIQFVETMCAPFLRSLEFVVTHAPCKHKHIAKLHGEGRKKQMNLRLGKKRKDFETLEAYTEFLETNLSFLKKDAEVGNMPIHIFGHVMLAEPMLLRKVKLGLDTGAGNKNGFLTSCQIGGSRRPYYVSQPVHQDEVAIEEPMPLLFKKKGATESIQDLVDLSVLDEFEERRLFRMASKKINFVSGTMSPSWVDTPAGKLETVHAALTYYSNMKVREVVLQPKYMGSRAQLYLFAEKPEVESSEQDMIVSRNGFAPRFLDLDAFYDEMRERHKDLFKELNAKLLIFDGELMPWSALGEGLIEDIFSPIAVGIRTELENLTALGLPEAYSGLMASFDKVKHEVNTKSKQDLAEIFGLENPDFEKRFAESRLPDISDEEHERGRKAFAEKLGHSKVSSFYAMKEFNIVPFEDQKEYVEIYQRQLEVFGQMPDKTKANPFDYKAFALLKAIDPEGNEKVFIGPEELNDIWFRKINQDECLVLDLDSPEDWKKGEAFFQKLAAAELEGVVVKPRQTQFEAEVAPYLKVRAPNYLTLIYGWDYLRPERYRELMQKKSISRKLQVSIKEYELGRRLLEIPRAEISTENRLYLSLAMQLILEERAEKKLDPCL